MKSKLKNIYAILKDKKLRLNVVTSCRGRFHIFNQAAELYRNRILLEIITDYPKNFTRKFGIPNEKVKSLLFLGVLSHSYLKCKKFLPSKIRTYFDEKIHNRFSKKLSTIIPKNTDFFIGLSSFSYEAIKVCREKSILCAIDHGSLHQAESRMFIEKEARKWGITVSNEVAAKWVVNKEDSEFSLADFIFVPSLVSKQSLVRNGINPKKIFVNHYGVSLEEFFPEKKNDDIFRVIQVGGITLGKGVLTLLEGFNLLNIERSELIFVGGGFSTSEIKPLINSLKSSNTVFYPPVPQSQLRRYYNQSSVFVLASIEDGFGMVVLQAMACGLPVIVTENVGAKDLIINNVNGFVVPISSPEIIAKRLLELHDNPAKRYRMGLAAKASVISGYTWKDYGFRLSKFINQQCKE